MNAKAMVWPVVAMVALTFVVSRLLYRRRIAEMRAKRIPPQALATSAAMAAKLEDVTAADNYRNLFEAPVLFYVAAVVAMIFDLANAAIVSLAWVYVGCRVVHSAIHCTVNRVLHRLAAFLASHAVLFVLWLAIVWRLAFEGRG